MGQRQFDLCKVIPGAEEYVMWHCDEYRLSRAAEHTVRQVVPNCRAGPATKACSWPDKVLVLFGE